LIVFSTNGPSSGDSSITCFSREFDFAAVINSYTTRMQHALRILFSSDSPFLIRNGTDSWISCSPNARLFSPTSVNLRTALRCQ
jgi:hypothetical protein